ncbi:MAG: iron-containing redox enzyme family protein [Symploca sp. SIO1B1]|nr:iron-containing redox enzyme family protein [Symploca sp. SIO2D2]NER94454.1 iron-containing redox enzyme family protein [Symploca sp. SIO1B1]
MQWLLSLAEEYRKILRSGAFYKALTLASSSEDIRAWIYQLYYQSRDFTAALSLRHAICRDPHFQGCFAKHAMEEVAHCEQLIVWMRQHAFLEPDESPTRVTATLETLSVSAYCFRSVLRESSAHQVIALNLISEGVSYDFFSAVNPKLKELGLRVGPYWQIHKEIDNEHLAMGLDLIPQCEQDSSEGKVYAQIAWEMASLYSQMLSSWSSISLHQRIEPPTQLVVAPVYRDWKHKLQEVGLSYPEK